MWIELNSAQKLISEGQWANRIVKSVASQSFHRSSSRHFFVGENSLLSDRVMCEWMSESNHLNCSHIITDAIHIDTKIKSLWVGVKRKCTQRISVFHPIYYIGEGMCPKWAPIHFILFNSVFIFAIIVTITANHSWAYKVQSPITCCRFAHSPCQYFIGPGGLYAPRVPCKVHNMNRHTDRLMCKWCNEQYTHDWIAFGYSEVRVRYCSNIPLLHRCYLTSLLYTVELSWRGSTPQRLIFHFVTFVEPSYALESYDMVWAPDKKYIVDGRIAHEYRESRIQCTFNVESRLYDTLDTPSFFFIHFLPIYRCSVVRTIRQIVFNNYYWQ